MCLPSLNVALLLLCIRRTLFRLCQLKNGSTVLERKQTVWLNEMLHILICTLYFVFSPDAVLSRDSTFTLPWYHHNGMVKSRTFHTILVWKQDHPTIRVSPNLPLWLILVWINNSRNFIYWIQAFITCFCVLRHFSIISYLSEND